MESITHEVKITQYSGTHYEIGKEMGINAKKEFPDYIESSLKVMKDAAALYEGLGMRLDLSEEYVDHVFPQVENILREIHPDFIDEVKGFADGLEEDYRRVLVFTSNFGPGPGCSQFFTNGFLARNYDDAPASVENNFSLVKPQGSFASFGATAGFIQRLDGMNEKGLAASLTFGAGLPAETNGVGAVMFIRTALDKTTSVDEALDIFKRVPYVTPNNVLLADASGKAVIIEVSGREYRIREVDSEGIYCANSYLDPEMKQFQKGRNLTTKWREDKMDSLLGDLKNSEGIMNLLTADFPQGLFEPYFVDGLGTLWSVIYKPETKDVWLAVGEKGHGVSQTMFRLTDATSFEKMSKSLKAEMPNVDIRTRVADFRSSK